MGKRARLVLGSMASLVLSAGLVTAAIPASAAGTTYTIGVDNASPSGHNFEYVDFFPRGDVNQSTNVSSTVIRDGDTLDFKWNSASPDGFHTTTLLPIDTAPGPNTWGSDHPIVVPDEAADGANQLQLNPRILNPTRHDCGVGTMQACTYVGSELNSGAFPTVSGADFKVKISLGLDTSSPTTLHFVCLIHPGMQGAVTVLPSNVETDLTPSTQAALDAAATAQYTTNTADALNAETAADNKAVANNADGTHTITMTAGTASAHVEVLEMLPSRVEVRPGDHVKWVTTTKSDIHTVTFPKGHGSDSVDPIPFVCETEGGADTPATGPPPNGCSSPGLFENHANPAPQGGTAISSTSTVATSGIISSPPAPFPNSYTFTFPTTGTFAYMCRIHDNMVGTIVVNPAQANNNPAVLAQTGRPLPHATPWALIVAAATLLAGGLLFGIRRRLDRI